MKRLLIAVIFGAFALGMAFVPPSQPFPGTAVAATPSAKPSPKTGKPGKPTSKPSTKPGQSGSPKPGKSPSPKPSAGEPTETAPAKTLNVELCVGESRAEYIESHGSVTSNEAKPEGIASVSSSGNKITLTGSAVGETTITLETEEMSLTAGGAPSEMVHTKYVIHVKVVQCAFHKGDWVVPNQESFATPTPSAHGGANGGPGNAPPPGENAQNEPCFQKALTAARNAAKANAEASNKATYGDDPSDAADDARDAANSISDDAGDAAAGALQDGAKRTNGGALSDVTTMHYTSGDIDVFSEEGQDGLILRVTQVFIGKQACKNKGDWKDFVLVIISAYSGEKSGKKSGSPKSVHAWFKVLDCCDEETSSSAVPNAEQSESPSTPVKPKRGKGTGNEQSFYAPPNGDPNGELVGTVDDPSTNGPTGFYYEVVDQNGHQSFFQSVTDAAHKFMIIAPAGAVTIEFARYFDKKGDLDSAAQTDLQSDAPVTDTRPFEEAPPKGVAITDGNPAFDRTKPATFGVRGIDPRDVHVLVDGSENGVRTLAASSRSVVADLSGVSDGPHQFVIESDGIRTETMPADVVDLHVALVGPHQVGSTQQAQFQIVGLPSNHPATLDLTASGGSVFSNGSEQISIPVTDGTASTSIRNLKPGRTLLRYELHVKIPRAWN